MIYDEMGKAIVSIGESTINSTGNIIRRATNTRTDEEKCNSAWWSYFKSSSHTIASIEKENREMEKLLHKKNVNHRSIVKQRVRNISINENKMRDKSCSEEYFNQLMQKEKRIKEVKRKNEVLKELMVLNGIKNKKITYMKKKKKKKVKLDMIITEKINTDEEMKRAIEDVI